MSFTKMTSDEKARIVQLYKLGMTIRRIMVETGRSYGGVYDVLTREQVKMRKRGKEKQDQHGSTRRSYRRKS